MSAISPILPHEKLIPNVPDWLVSKPKRLIFPFQIKALKGEVGPAPAGAISSWQSVFRKSDLSASAEIRNRKLEIKSDDEGSALARFDRKHLLG